MTDGLESSRPLLASSHGRITTGTLRDYVYRWTRPCAYGEGCPHDRDPDTREVREHGSASQCPASVSPAVIEQHYDRRSEKEKMEQRRAYLDD